MLAGAGTLCSRIAGEDDEQATDTAYHITGPLGDGREEGLAVLCCLAFRTPSLVARSDTDVHQVRRRFKGQLPMPKIGYGSNKKTRHLIPSGHKELLVNNLGDLELLLMHNQKYAASIAHGVSSKKRIEILARAKVLGVK